MRKKISAEIKAGEVIEAVRGIKTISFSLKMPAAT